ncbi:sulfite exporter TauE/SafE family protein [Parapedobacter sp. ISTM3]|uniref:sulfite exporter TauE/SafE family protein n=1 Tax=Parapedobacter sp. ISTM3 TaxID=2800130 RepID=UPI00190763DA|nr:sulfite exporter TauE/SafE family protein [Parapedobacter sp. ISTM3]MBK1442395.1 sulfite exporter TauE/SafE family protein [Parapedobacter sp. ISTM3]
MIAYSSALVIGLIIGLTGSGGALLAIPSFVYLFHINPLLATTYSLFMVSTTSFIGVASKWKARLVDWRMVCAFGLPSVASLYLTRKWLLPRIPDPVIHIGGFPLEKPMGILLLFATLMLGAGISMVRRKPAAGAANPKSLTKTWPLFIAEGIIIGALGGLVGNGGGFLIIPALIFLGNLSVQQAMGTTLFIVAVNTFIGFLGSLPNPAIEWPFLLTFTALATLGASLGLMASSKVSGPQLQKGFGWLVIGMAVFILLQELH